MLLQVVSALFIYIYIYSETLISEYGEEGQRRRWTILSFCTTIAIMFVFGLFLDKASAVMVLYHHTVICQFEL